VEQQTMALFDLPYQWIFPVVFIAMTAIIAISFMKYVILADDKDDEEETEEAVKREVAAPNQADEKNEAVASVQASEKSEEKDSK
jgi:hypothetical protein